MTLEQFIQDCTALDNPIGDLANDIMEDTNFPSDKPEIEILNYLDFQTRMSGTHDVFQEFKSEYQKHQ